MIFGLILFALGLVVVISAVDLEYKLDQLIFELGVVILFAGIYILCSALSIFDKMHP